MPAWVIASGIVVLLVIGTFTWALLRAAARGDKMGGNNF